MTLRLLTPPFAILLLLSFLPVNEAMSQVGEAIAKASTTGPNASGPDVSPVFVPNDVDEVLAFRREGVINLDGLQIESDWALAPVITSFTQRDPEEGEPATERTEVRVIYDDDAIYVSARMYDSAPDSIVAQLARRDDGRDSDLFGVFLDPYRDLRTGFYFGVNAAGTLYDGVLMNDDWDDESWDGVWEGKATRDDQGWTAELRIPFSQLRFHAAEEHTWGINFIREIARKNERDFLVYSPREESGFVSRFPELTGMRDIHPKRQIEVVPYVTQRAEFLDHAENDPFNDGSRFVSGFGADFKVGVTSNLTLNATVNPDFGQVEVDPAVVNLSDVETFFPEKRPFFIEGANIFSGFGRGGSNNNWGFNWSNPNFFYSRRVGRAPQGGLPSNDYSERQDAARILGATKLTGKVGDDWTVGTIQSLTERAVADYSLDGDRLRAEVEPLAYYGVYRAQKEFSDGRKAIGFLGTAVQRGFRDDRLKSSINGGATGFGVDAWTFLDEDKVWALTGWLGASRVTGTRDRIFNLQQNSRHYFQRPDSDILSLDSTATSLSGMAGRAMLNKQSGRFTTNVALGFVSPGFDINDAGFISRTNVVNGHAVLTYRWTDPGSWYRNINANVSAFNSADFDGNTTWRGLWTGHFITFLNYHSLFFNSAYNPETVNNRMTRGGPLTLNQPGYQFGGEYDTDSRKSLVMEFGGFTYQQKDSNQSQVYVEAVYKPAPNVNVAIQPRVSWNNEHAQWVGAYEDATATQTFGSRFVFAELDQVTVSSTIRLNWTFTPQLSFQLFAQPLISAGEYSNYKELKAPKTFDFLNYGEEGSSLDLDDLVADPDGSGPAPSIALPEQDFNFRSLRGTAVARWEYNPGSTLFFVWTQSRSDYQDFGDLRFNNSVDGLLGAKPDNIFMVKFTYWISR